MLKSNPIIITGLKYETLIFNEHMEIGCEHHSFDKWSDFTDKQILEMDGKEALTFWNEHQLLLLSLCEKQARVK